MSSWQHCGRLDDHDEHPFVARQQVVVERCVCDAKVCICPETPWPQAAERRKFMCPGKQVRSVEVPVTPQVR